MMGGNILITQNKLRELLDYNSKTGQFIWRKDVSCAIKQGAVAGSLDNGYTNITIRGIGYGSHRLVWLYVYGYLPENDIDHINRDRSDNRLENLREVSRQCNCRNTGNAINNTSGVKGVSFVTSRNKWTASIRNKPNRYFLGYFTDLTEAVAHRLAAEQCLDWEGCDSSSPAYLYMVDACKFRPNDRLEKR